MEKMLCGLSMMKEQKTTNKHAEAGFLLIFVTAAVFLVSFWQTLLGTKLTSHRLDLDLNDQKTRLYS